MPVLGLEGPEKICGPPPKDNFWNSPERDLSISFLCLPTLDVHFFLTALHVTFFHPAFILLRSIDQSIDIDINIDIEREIHLDTLNHD